jgi:hypothetical protein
MNKHPNSHINRPEVANPSAFPFRIHIMVCGNGHRNRSDVPSMANSSTNTSDLLEVTANRNGFTHFDNFIFSEIAALMILLELLDALKRWKLISVVETGAIGQRIPRIEVAEHCIEIQISLPKNPISLFMFFGFHLSDP